MKNFKRFKKLADIAFVFGTSMYFTGACFQPDTASGIRIQNIFFAVGIAAVIIDIICKAISKFFKKRYMEELKAALNSSIYLKSCLQK